MYKGHIKEQVKAMLPEYLRDLGIDPHKTFRCICSDHNDMHPSMCYDWNRYKVHCFSCGADMDIFDVYQEVNRSADLKSAFRGVYEWMENRNSLQLSERLPTPLPKAEKPDMTAEIVAANDALQKDTGAYKHFISRGIALGIIDQYKLGYAPAGMNALLKKYPAMQSQSILQKH